MSETQSLLRAVHSAKEDRSSLVLVIGEVSDLSLNRILADRREAEGNK